MGTSRTSSWATIEELCDRYLGGRPSPAVLAQMKPVETERAEVRDLVERMLRFMGQSRFDPKDFAPSQAWVIGTLIPEILPGAWGGSIPPYTWEGRHKRIDAYLKANPWSSFGAGTVLLEIGCGFPPQTAIDAARVHPEWQIVGADPCFDEYLLYDADGNYACLDPKGAIRYFHAAPENVGGLRTLYEDRPATFRRFGELFGRLVSCLPKASDGEMTVAEGDGARLIRNPLRQYERKNLSLVKAGIGDELPKADIIRCFNVLVYFDAQFRREADNWARAMLRPDGLLICGVDNARTCDARYSVYRKENGQLTAKEFAFSIDNARSTAVLPWFAMHDDEPDVHMLVRLLSLLRADSEFCALFDARYDTLLADYRFFVRDTDGALVTAPDPLPQAKWIEAREAILLALEREEFADRAVAVLRNAGISAWVNCVGHVAVDPASVPIR